MSLSPLFLEVKEGVLGVALSNCPYFCRSLYNFLRKPLTFWQLWWSPEGSRWHLKSTYGNLDPTNLNSKSRLVKELEECQYEKMVSVWRIFWTWALLSSPALLLAMIFL